MPTNTFEALATTVVSGTSTNIVTFSGLNTSTYKNFIIIGSCRTSGGSAFIGLTVNGVTAYDYWVTQINCQSAQPAFSSVPVTSIDNNNYIKLSNYQTSNNSGNNLVFRSTITNPAGGRTNILSECLNFNASNNTTAWTHTNAYFQSSLSSISVYSVGAGTFDDTSTFSIYGLV